MMVLLGTLLCLAFTWFCLKKGDEWGAGAFILWASGMFIVASYYGTV